MGRDYEVPIDEPADVMTHESDDIPIMRNKNICQVLQFLQFFQ